MGFFYTVALLAVVVYFFFPSLISKPNKSPRTVEVEDAPQKPGEGRPRRNATHAHELIKTPVPGCLTVDKLFQHSVEKFADRNCMGARNVIRVEKKEVKVQKSDEVVTQVHDVPYCSDYVFKTYREVSDLVAQFGAGLEKVGVQPLTPVTIFANTRPEWQVAAQACLARSMPIVTIYATLGVDALAHSLKQVKATCVITEAELVDTLMKALSEWQENIPGPLPLKDVIYLDKNASASKMNQLRQRLAALKIKLHSFQELITVGHDKKAPTRPPKPEDVGLLMYTSGTTGLPKAVVLTHSSMCAAIGGGLKSFGRLSENDVYLAYLPLAHVLEFVVEMAVLHVGAAIGFGSARRLTDDTAFDDKGKPRGDLSALRPTLLVAVPAILERIKAGILSKVKKGPLVLQWLFDIACYSKKLQFQAGMTKSIWDWTVFAPVRRALGGRLGVVVCGGAPLAKATQEFVTTVIAPVQQGYGLTETAAAVAMSHLDDLQSEVVGAPFPCAEVKLVDQPDMKYTSGDKDESGRATPRGEIAVSGPMLSNGYLHNQAKTDEDFRADQEGKMWFYTGDIGQWMENGTLKIIDRKKDLVKLPHGEYVALGKLDSAYSQSDLVNNIATIALQESDSVVAVVLPNRKQVEALASSVGAQGSWADVCNDEKVVKKALQQLNDAGKKAGLSKFEMLSNVLLVTDEWNSENGLTTEALKVKRNAIKDKYSDEISDMLKGKDKKNQSKKK